MSGRPDSETEVTIPVKVIKMAGWLLSALIAGGGGSVLVRSADPPAYDRFTGSDGDDLEKEIKMWCKEKTTERLEPIRKDTYKLEGAIETCRNGLTQVQRGIALIERDGSAMQRKVNNLAEKAARHNKEAEAWKRKIEINAQWISHLRGNDQ